MTTPDRVQPESVVKLQGVWAGYDHSPVLEDVSLDVPEGQVLALVGPNGGGKTTVLRIILGLLQPSRGTVRVLVGQPREVRHRIGYLPQAAQPDPSFPATVWDTVAMGRLRPTMWPQRLQPRGEAVALRRQHVEPEHRRVRVEESATEVGGRLEWGKPKTHETRTVILPRFVIDELVPAGQHDERRPGLHRPPWRSTSWSQLPEIACGRQPLPRRDFPATSCPTISATRLQVS